MSKGSKPAVQKRSRKTRDQIIEALDRLLRIKEFDQISVTELAEEAGVSPGSIYRRFEGGLIPVLFELCRDRIERRADEPQAQIDASAAVGLRVVLRLAAAAVWGQLSSCPHVYRAAHLQARLRPDLIGDAWKALEDSSLQSFRDIIAAFPDEVRRRDLDRAAAMVAYHFNTVFIERGLFADRSPNWRGLPDSDGFARDVADFAYGFLITAED